MWPRPPRLSRIFRGPFCGGGGKGAGVRTVAGDGVGTVESGGVAVNAGTVGWAKGSATSGAFGVVSMGEVEKSPISMSSTSMSFRRRTLSESSL